MANCSECKEARAKNAQWHSAEWSVSEALAKENKRLFIIVTAVLVLWLLTLVAFFVQRREINDIKKLIAEGNTSEVTTFTENQSDVSLKVPFAVVPEKAHVKRKDGVMA